MANPVVKYFKQIKANALEMVQPHLVAIYEDRAKGERTRTEQIGTGFLIDWQGRSVLVTAKHTLFGQNWNENRGDKAIFVAGSLKKIGDLSLHDIFHAPDHDLAAMHVEEFSLERCLPSSCLCQLEATPKAVTIQGFLARDFKADVATGALHPAPRIYTNSRKDYGSGYVGLRCPKSRNRDTDSGKKVMAPRPSGMSGGPMLDGDKLANGQVSVIGVFTHFLQERGMAFGESSSKVLMMLGQM